MFCGRKTLHGLVDLGGTKAVPATLTNADQRRFLLLRPAFSRSDGNTSMVFTKEINQGNTLI